MMENNRIETRKRRLLYVVIVLLAVVLFVLAVRVFSLIEKRYNRGHTSADDAYAYQVNGRPEYLIDGQWYAQKKNVETVLLIGIDKYDAQIPDAATFRNTQQSDALFVLAIDHDNKSYTLLQINRDTVANIRALDLNGDPYMTFPAQLALAHTYGSGKEDSCENVLYSVSDYLYGLQIDHYASFSMDAVGTLNDDVGGVTLTVIDDLTPADPTLIEGTEVTLMGEHALTYIRARTELVHNTNLDRMKRQKQYLGALIEQTQKSLAADDTLSTRLIRDVTPHMVTDCSATKLASFADVVKKYENKGIRSVDGTAIKGEQFMEFYADEDALRALVLDIFYEKQ